MSSIPNHRAQGLSASAVQTFVDEQTGRNIRQLTDAAKGARLGYFRITRQLPDGRLLGGASHDVGWNLIAIDAESGDVEPLTQKFHPIRVRESDGKGWMFKQHDKEDETKGWDLFEAVLPYGEVKHVATISGDVPGNPEDITCDGRRVIFRYTEQDLKSYPIPTTKNKQAIWSYFNRPRRGSMWVYDLESTTHEKIYETQDICPLHIDASPTDPTLLRFCHDMYDAYGQRTWTIRTDGSDARKIRPQEYGELVTHEFWWPGADLIGYTYQDRRGDETLDDLPWAEYSPRATHLGIANRAGEEVYLSDPMPNYHSHLYRSNDGKLVSGEGCQDASFVFAGELSMASPRLNMIPLATIHTPFVPFRGQGVDCNFSVDGKWLIYADKRVDGDPHQLYAVEVDL